MGTLADRLNTIAVRVMSPDATVRMYLTGGGQLHIEFARGCLHQHTESSLATQLGHVSTAALRKRKNGMNEAVRQVIADMDVDEDDAFDAAPAPHTSRARQLEKAAAGITAKGRSPRSVVTIRRIPGDIMDVKVRKGTLERFSAEEVTVEIHEALRAVSDDYQAKLLELRRELASVASKDGAS